MKRSVVAVAVIMLVGALAVSVLASAQAFPWNKLAFDGQSRAWDASRMRLVLEPDGTMTAYLLVRDIYIDISGETVRVSWKGHPREETVFNGLVQTRGLSTREFLDRIKTYDNVPGQLAGIFWASDETNWEIGRLRDHDSVYRQEIYFRIVGQGMPLEREELMFVLQGIPISELVHGQFIFLYPGNPDGTVDHVWFNPGWLDLRDHAQYWTRDCQDKEAEGEIINGRFTPNGIFSSVPISCSW